MYILHCLISVCNNDLFSVLTENRVSAIRKRIKATHNPSVSLSGQYQ